MQPLVNFVLGNISDWEDIAVDKAREVSIHDLAPRIRMGREIWNVHAFQLLRQLDFPVRLSGTFDPEAINVAHCDDIRHGPDLWRYFIVSVRADRDPAFLSHMEIVQNQLSIWSKNDYYIPHWPQPGLIAREPSRGKKVENIIYMGKDDNLDNAFKTKHFRQSLERMGMRLLIQENEWWDYHEADVVLAVRGGPQFYLAIKPATKLVNAWLAGCPAILSPEPGYSELWKSDIDYFEATEPAEVLTTLSKLRDSPELMAQMIANGKVRATEFEADAIAHRWEQFLVEMAAGEFHRWQRNASELGRKRRYYTALVKRHLWGHWAVGKHKAQWKEALGRVRRRVLLPRSVCAS